MFYFQPAEEGPSDFIPDGKNTWGAKMMIQEGVMKSPKPDAVFGLHVWAGVPAGQIAYRPGPTLASSDDLRIKILGKQTNAGRPWDGIDPITVGAQTIVGLQTVVSRRTDISSYPSVVSIGTINGGTRYNIIPESVDMTGTIRSYDYGIRQKLHADVRQTVEKIAESGGAKAEVTIIEKYDPTINNPALTVGAGLPAKASAFSMQGSKPPSLASQLLQSRALACLQLLTLIPLGSAYSDVLNQCPRAGAPKPCRSRLAGEGVGIFDAGLKAAFAGKPAPTKPSVSLPSARPRSRQGQTTSTPT